ncbi:hypothetical protein AX16_002204, partial [Volvariella volvacea WC 439]
MLWMSSRNHQESSCPHKLELDLGVFGIVCVLQIASGAPGADLKSVHISQIFRAIP